MDNTNLASATIQITGNYQNGQDVLSFTNTANITGTWTAATGTLTLSGTDTVANYQAALRAVKYQNTSDNPSGLTRTVSFTVNDGTAEQQHGHAEHRRHAGQRSPRCWRPSKARPWPTPRTRRPPRITSRGDR